MIFIDPPYWPAHGTVFSHLISDASLAELHDFAAANDVAKRAFDLDHYDVPARRYDDLVAAGAVAVSGKDLARTLVASGLRIKAKYRVKSAGSVLELRWDALLPGQRELGAELLRRWNEPHRHYHCTSHLLAVLESLDLLTNSSPPPAVALAAWFHDAIYEGVPGRDEEQSADLARHYLTGLVEPPVVDEVVRLVRLTVQHTPAANDHAGALLCDADLAILGSAPLRYGQYVTDVRKDYAHIPQDQFNLGRAAVLRQLLALEPLFRTDSGQQLWAAPARRNMSAELAQLNLANGQG
ncbi:DUF4031 domain-containing protein [Arthrobacter sp. HLT1-20]